MFMVVGVSGWFYMDHNSLIKKIDDQAINLTKLQLANSKQTDTIKSLLGCVNQTENIYKQTQKYSSTISCIKLKFNVK